MAKGGSGRGRAIRGKARRKENPIQDIHDRNIIKNTVYQFKKITYGASRAQLLLLMPNIATKKTPMRLKTETTEFVQLSHSTVSDPFHFPLSAMATLPAEYFHFVISNSALVTKLYIQTALVSK